MEYLGEHLLPGNIGQWFIVLSFVLALLSFLSYTFGQLNFESGKIAWKTIGRWSFKFHTLSVIGIAVCLFYIIYNHLFEYHYAWSHSSRALPAKYIISSFWEGQEGSFLLWTFWHALIGLWLMKWSRKWETPVMAILSLAQVVLSSMLLGYFIFGVKIGSSPFILLREAMSEAPIFAQANYLELYIKDGKGLNPLLQNPWMVIHPPILFLGFALTVVPFAFAVAALWTKSYKSWVAPALPWALFGAMFLGMGIMMGGAWAYESLSFGGYWAWDPVENASLVPWLTLIAAVHVLIVYKNTKHSAIASFILSIVSFLLILYATFLTRSGVLGDTSVHAFTDLGLSGQLLALVFIFVAMPIIFSFQTRKFRLIAFGIFIGIFLLNVFSGQFLKYVNASVAITGLIIMLINFGKYLPKSQKEELTYSREFWLFMGALVLCLSSLQVLIGTSFPVINKLVGTSFSKLDELSYNRIQLPIAVIIVVLTVIGQFLKYKNTDKKAFYKSLIIPFVIALASTIAIVIAMSYTNFMYVLLLFASLFGFFGNGQMALQRIKKIKFSGAAVSHMGFALMLVGILFSSTLKEVISVNKSGMSFGKEFDDKANHENVLLWKDEPYKMAEYYVTYIGDSIAEPNHYYKVKYTKTNAEGKIKEQFILYPNAQINPKMGLIASPDTRHYAHKDIYNHVTQVLDKELARSKSEYGEPLSMKFASRNTDTVMLKKNLVIVKGISANLTTAERDKIGGESTMAIKAVVNVKNERGSFELNPIFAIKNGAIYNYDDDNEEAGVKVKFAQVYPEEDKIELMIAEKDPLPRDYIIMKAIVFPYINLLWIGLITLIIGFSMAVTHRWKQAENKL